MGEKTGPSLIINALESLASTNNIYLQDLQAGQADLAIKFWFSSLKLDLLNRNDDGGQPMFERVLAKLGKLDSKQMYSFVPALALGCPNTVEKMQKVSIVEHLLLLAQLEELQVMAFPDMDFDDIE